MGNARNNVKNAMRKLILALEHKHGRQLTMTTQEFVGVEGKKHTLYAVKEPIWDEAKHKYINNELFKTASTIQMTLYLRDMFYELEGKELPTDNEIWNQIRERIKDNG